MSASEDFFNTTELLEMTLELLSLKDLLRVHSVCKQWNATITGSSTLQQNLFLLPAKDETAWLVDMTNLPSQKSPLPGVYKSKLYVKAAAARRSEAYQSHHGLVVTPLRINPLLLRNPVGPTVLESIDLRVDSGCYFDLRILCKRLFELRHHVMMEMYLTQPPIGRIYVQAEVFHPGNHEDFLYHHKPSARICEEQGVRLKHVVEAIGRLGTDGGIEDVSVHLSGGVEVDEVDEEVVRRRTLEWTKCMADRG